MKILLAILFTGISVVYAQYPDGKDILKKIDQNLSSENRVFTSKMVIHGRRASRTIESKTWTAGEKKSFTEYLFPAREQGTKMLKLEDQLWIYSPSTDRIIQIAGHMLRQSVMGSDLSYEDLMEDNRLLNHYNAVVTGTENIADRPCWVVKLTAFDPNMAYQGLRLWVDKERNIPLKEEMFAKSGTLLKRSELSNVENINGRWYPKKIVFKDMLKDGEGTEFIIENIQFNVAIPDYIFSKANLKK
ncbi:MAG TPA: outer membrane lipoprotein-sorting protein [Bacteroidales bacterium]|nr:outer membrane lipoprotein-sorting protein [Bacteroidales bacterium]